MHIPERGRDVGRAESGFRPATDFARFGKVRSRRQTELPVASRHLLLTVHRFPNGRAHAEFPGELADSAGWCSEARRRQSA